MRARDQKLKVFSEARVLIFLSCNQRAQIIRLYFELNYFEQIIHLSRQTVGNFKGITSITKLL